MYKVIWLQSLLYKIELLEIMIKDNYLYTVAPLILIYVNNQRAIKLMENPKYHHKTKCIVIKYHKTCKLVNYKTILLK